MLTVPRRWLSQFRAVSNCEINGTDIEVFRSSEEEAGFRIQAVLVGVKWV